MDQPYFNNIQNYQCDICCCCCACLLRDNLDPNISLLLRLDCCSLDRADGIGIPFVRPDEEVGVDDKDAVEDAVGDWGKLLLHVCGPTPTIWVDFEFLVRGLCCLNDGSFACWNCQHVRQKYLELVISNNIFKKIYKLLLLETNYIPTIVWSVLNTT